MGAILTQNTAWSNVEKAIANLKRERVISSASTIRAMPSATLSRLIRPAGYYNVKAKRLKECARFLVQRLGPGLRRADSIDTATFRRELLAVNGIGPETADSVLLYAFGRSVFVIDAYTRRMGSRYGLLRGDEPYGAVQELFAGNLPRQAALFNEYHALIVRLGKEFCRTKPRCAGCPLERLCAHGRENP